MADEFVPIEREIGTGDCSDIQPWDRKSLRYDYILKATTGDEDYPFVPEDVPEEVGICTNLWVHGNAQIDNILINQTITGNPTSYLGNVTAYQLIVSGISTLGVTTTTNLTAQQLNVSGICTFGLSATSTPPSNSQMSFELTSNSNLRIKVRGTDGQLRSVNFTLS